jgi:ABC-type nitrate/sulfonate/bicarbonate transport system substrate-binding protein
MRKALQWALGGLLIAFVVLVIAKTPQPGPEGQEVRIGYLPYSSGLPFFVAQEKGFFKKEKLDIQAVKVASANEAIDAIPHTVKD